MNDQRHSLRFARQLLLACGASMLLANIAEAAPKVVEPIVAIVNNPEIPSATEPEFVLAAINGSGFGSPVSGSKVRLKDLVQSPNMMHEWSSQHSRVVVWSDTRIVIKLPPQFQYPRIWVRLSNGSETEPVLAERYEYNYFDTNSGGSGNPYPVALATNDTTTGFLNEQWHTGLKKWNLATGAVSSIGTVPTCPSPGCFAVQLFGTDQRTNVSVIGDSAMVDPSGTAWFVEGGSGNYTGVQPNHSRIVSYLPDGTFKIYNIPGDDNEISGLAWDDATQRVWFAQRARWRCIGYACATAQPAKIVSFKPSAIAHDNSFDFVAAVGSETCDGGSLGAAPSTPPTVGTCHSNPWRSCFTAHDCVLLSQVCPAGATQATDTACFHEYPIANSTQISQLAVVPGGNALWFANHWASTANIGRLNMATGAATTYPLHWTTPGIFAFGPWRIRVAANGDALFSHPARHTVGRFDVSLVDDPICTSLTSPTTNCTTSPNTTCVNPCIDERVPPGFTTVSQTVSNVAEDLQGRVWFNQGGLVADNKYASSVGFWKGDRTSVVLFPSPQIYAGNSSSCTILGGPAFYGFSGADITINRDNNEVWFADYCRKRIGRIRPAENEVCVP